MSKPAADGKADAAWQAPEADPVVTPPVARGKEASAGAVFPDPPARPMAVALAAAEAAGREGEVPVGAVILGPNGSMLASAGNRVYLENDPTAHAEILAIRAACAGLGRSRLDGCDLYVTLEPCPMCAAAIGAARIRRLYFGAADPKSGGVEHGPRVLDSSSAHHRPEIYGGIGETAAAALLKTFFRARR